MKIKLEPEYSSFNDRVVKCTMKCTIYDCDPLVESIYALSCTSKLENSVEGVNVYMYKNVYEARFTVKSIAKCSPYDNFDYITGCRIAESKACMKAYKKLEVLIIKILNIRNQNTKTLEEAFNKIAFINEREQVHYESLIQD